MADKDQDEYQFADLDAIAPDESASEADTDVDTTASESDSPVSAMLGQKNVRRNALIVVGIVVTIMIVYKVIVAFETEKKSTATIAPTPQVQPVVQAPVQPKPQEMIQSMTKTDPRVNQKLSDLESGQQNALSEISNVNNQLGNINNNVNAMGAKLAELSTVISNLNAKLEDQSHEIERLRVQRIPKPVHRHVTRKKVHHHHLRYYLQAVIPGRAWLIAGNGSTLTVREGSVVAGYGVVKLIDPNQGRVITSSGQVIKFSQTDS